MQRSTKRLQIESKQSTRTNEVLIVKFLFFSNYHCLTIILLFVDNCKKPRHVPKDIVITAVEDANENKRTGRKEKADKKKGKEIEFALTKRMEELRDLCDIIVIQEASKKKGKTGKQKRQERRQERKQ